MLKRRMERLDSDDLEYMVDGYFSMEDGFWDDEDSLLKDHVVGIEGIAQDEERGVEMIENKEKTDTSALEARKGKDMQGIPWELLNFTRDEYREMRLKQYKNYECLPLSREGLEKECKHALEGCNFYEFQFNTRMVRPTVAHFQLRNLVWATSKHDVYLMQNYSIMHWSSLRSKGTEVLNLVGPIVPTQRPIRSSELGLSRVQVTTMAIKSNLIVAGGFQGELLCMDLDKPGVIFCTKMSSDDNAITNCVDIHGGSNSTRVVAANNDSYVRIFDAANLCEQSRFSFPWSVNNTTFHPDGKLIAVLGDATECLIMDTQSGKTIATLKGHLDYSFSSAWHPNGYTLATGNQDTTCRLWDLRNSSKSSTVLKGKMGAIRSIKFTNDGCFMAMAEPADFVHVFDVASDYEQCQEIDLFGEIAGVSFSPDMESLFVGIADRTYGSLLEFNRRHRTCYMDTLL